MGEVKKLQRPPLERVVIVDPVHEDAIALLSQEFEVEVRLYPSEDELLELLERADIVVLRSGVRLSAAVIQAAPRLRIIARAGVGLDNIDIDAARAAGIAVFNVPDATTRAVAEFAIGLILALARKIPQADAAMRAGRWEKPQLEGVELPRPSARSGGLWAHRIGDRSCGPGDRDASHCCGFHAILRTPRCPRSRWCPADRPSRSAVFG